ncbi:ABC transporter protein [Mycena indigotica]|uniref:ABC transporter protein n=1 Tax=Mycena indigotica TaxID=2126181 RepID=A0A8H6WG05_9AGAR|nr:ABC transporter protein [Mycena indigotica]KAF7315316.1 ABC transporter protein [Mycena indigotica]
MNNKDAKPFPLDTSLRDLALIRVSELDVASLIPTNPGTMTSGVIDVDSTVAKSYEFVAEARAAIKLRGHKIGSVGERVDACLLSFTEQHVYQRTFVLNHDMVSALLLLRVLAPVPVLLTLFTLLRTPPSVPHSPVDITRVVIPTIIARRGLILTLLTLLSFSALLDGCLFVIFAVLDKTWPRNTGIEYNAVLAVFAFAGLAALGAWKDLQGVNVWSLKRLKVAVLASSLLDLALVILLVKSFRTGSRFPLTHESLTILFPSFRVLAGFVLIAVLASPRIVYKAVPQDSENDIPTDSSSLLPPPSTGLSPLSAVANESNKYGTFRPTRSGLASSNTASRVPSPLPSEVADQSTEKPEISLDPSWTEIWQRLLRITPYLWPSKSRSLQLLMALCIILILVGRVVNASVPFTLGEIVRIFEGTSQRSVWPVLLLYVLLRFLQGSGGLAALRDCLWTPVMQYSDRQMSQLAFDHLLQLSFNFHIHRNTGQVLRVLDRGAAINHTLEHLIFTIAPTFIDIAIALVVFSLTFGLLLASVVFAVLFLYVSASVILTRWRTRIRRQMNECDIVTRGIASDTLLNYETVKYFSGEEQESLRYQEAIGHYQALESKVIFSLNLLNLVQNLIISTGLLAGSLIVAHRVTSGQAAPSDFIIFITYLAQLYGPLNQIGFMYRTINQTLVDTEKLLQLLNEPTEVEDRDNASTLVVDGGEIQFENVSFSYDNRTTALNGVSFTVPKGSSVALVGESGSGKSTITRLLYRLYDLPEGSGRILIDGQDIRDVTQKSLRGSIGVVPQDCVLFNRSMAYNIEYGKFGATNEEIEEAAKSAQIHERITTFPDGYQTKVGERGVRLSGGERQRVAIARTLLKNPPILLLDEATSALDSSTEKDIQKALQNLMRGRSSLSIAHRLSTIASADLILVLKDGQIIERGTHAELLAADGVFAAMWADQITTGDVPTPPPVTDKPLPEEPVEDSAEPIVTGYSAQVEEPAESIEVTEPISEVATESPQPILLEEVPVIDSQPTDADHEASAITPVAFPTSEPEFDSATPNAPLDVQPVTFPVSDDASLAENTPIASPGVTFEPNLSQPTTTTDPEAEPKRKRISSQNFQRLARRISIGTRRQGSTSSIASIIPGLKRDKSGDETSVRAEGSGRNSVDSPTGSLSGDKDVVKGKKKKEKRKTLSG